MSPAAARPRIVVVTGVSGSGKSTAGAALEDLGYYCVDNLPAPLLRPLVELTVDGGQHRHLAVVLDARSSLLGPAAAPSEPLGPLMASRSDVQVLFLDAHDDVLLRRFSETRRRHPLGRPGERTLDALAREREALGELRALATAVLDTSRLNVHALRAWMKDRFGPTATRGASTEVVVLSFGYKYGVPLEADYLFDLRHLPNPHFDATLRPLTGRDGPVAAFLCDQPPVAETLRQIEALLDYCLPRHEAEGRALVTVAVGCTGGRHRSVYAAEALADHLRGRHTSVTALHRDVEEADR